MASGWPARCPGIWTTTRNSLCRGDRWEAIALPPGALIGWWAIPYHQWVTSPDLWRSTISRPAIRIHTMVWKALSTNSIRPGMTSMGSRNIHDIRLGVELRVNAKWLVRPAYHNYWLANATDALYASNGLPITRG